ncbi:MAG: VOC family protein [Leptolyngbyaceae bacterium]|nr:VOC family protein [Leptolyngbyaceae bacterium]
MFQCHSALVTLATTDFDRLVEFYSQLLQQSPQPHSPNSYAEFQLPGLRLGLFKPKGTSEAEFQHQTATGMSLCLEVGDLEAAIAGLTQLGCPPPDNILTASHGREIYAYDPAGNRLILHQSW